MANQEKKSLESIASDLQEDNVGLCVLHDKSKGSYEVILFGLKPDDSYLVVGVGKNKSLMEAVAQAQHDYKWFEKRLNLMSATGKIGRGVPYWKALGWPFKEDKGLERHIQKNNLTLIRHHDFLSKGKSKKNPGTKPQTSSQESKIWTEDEIRDRLEKDDLAVMRAICALYRRQEEAEKYAKSTIHQNFVGFSAFHAKTGSRYARFMSDGRNDGVFRKPLSGTEVDSNGVQHNRIDRARKLALFYVRQLTEIANTPGDPKTKKNPLR